MSEPNAESGSDLLHHVTQSIPYEWRVVQTRDQTFVVRDVPEGTAELYVVSAASRNVRTFAKADAALYNGKVVEPFFDQDTRRVEFQHDFAGVVGRESVEEWLDAPAVRLKRLPSTDPVQALYAGGASA